MKRKLEIKEKMEKKEEIDLVFRFKEREQVAKTAKIIPFPGSYQGEQLTLKGKSKKKTIFSRINDYFFPV